MRKVIIAVLLGSLFGILASSPALAQEEDAADTITVEGNTITMVVGGVGFGEEGEVLPLVDFPVPAGLVGATCTGVVQAENNSSVHPDNDLIMSTGGQTFEAPNVEDVSGGTQTFTGSVVIGSNLSFSLRLGPDGVTSGDLTVVLDCTPQAVAPTTTAPVAPTTTAPVGGVAAGAGGTSTDDASSTGLLFVALGVLALAGGGVLVAAKR